MTKGAAKSEQGAQALVERVQNDADFRRRLEEAPTPEERKEIVEAAGYDVGPDDVPAIKKAAGVEAEISDEQLENVAGGADYALLEPMARKA